MLEDLDNALTTATEFLAEEEAHFRKTRDTFGNRHRSTDEANERVIEAKAKVKAAKELSEKNHSKVDQARIERHEAFEAVQQVCVFLLLPALFVLALLHFIGAVILTAYVRLDTVRIM